MLAMLTLKHFFFSINNIRGQESPCPENIYLLIYARGSLDLRLRIVFQDNPFELHSTRKSKGLADREVPRIF